MRVLLVEDDPVTRTFLHGATASLGVEIDLAACMRQALVLAGRVRYSAWLLDARLPDGSGVELLHALRQRQPGIPALAHTAATDPEELQRLRAAGFDAALSKPLSAADWQAAVNALLAMTTPLPASTDELPPLWDDAAALGVLGGNADTLAALRELFFAELPQSISTLERASATGDAASIHADLHRLSASCGFVGAARLAAAIAHWRSDPDTITTLVQTARQTLASRQTQVT